ncbi:MAG: hypothetical protein HC850_02105 [Rhodomicrobium sp.]|nr:hypothetical protein [Rhodomicrobium sp.]
MRLLFYTATTAFLLIAGVFAYYALQSSEPGTGARVVLNIDASKMPADNAAPSDADRNMFAEAEAKLKSLESNDSPPALETSGQSGQLGESQSAEASDITQDSNIAATPETQQDSPPGFSITTDANQSSGRENDGSARRGAASADRGAPASPAAEANLAPPPGTALAGLEPESPVFRRLEQPFEAEQKPDDAAAAGAAPQDESPIADQTIAGAPAAAIPRRPQLQPMRLRERRMTLRKNRRSRPIPQIPHPYPHRRMPNLRLKMARQPELRRKTPLRKNPISTRSWQC